MLLSVHIGEVSVEKNGFGFSLTWLFFFYFFIVYFGDTLYTDLHCPTFYEDVRYQSYFILMYCIN